MVRPAARGDLARSPERNWSHLLYGCDPSPGIVSLDANNAGRGRVWRRVGDVVEANEHRFPNWFLATSLDLLAHLPARHLTATDLRAAHGELAALSPADGLCVVKLDTTSAEDQDVYRYLVLTNRLAEVETALVEMSNKRDGGTAERLADLRGLVLVLPPIEQFLILTGRTSFKGMAYGDLVRMQFDLETTGLDEERDRIFMISMRDSRGWTDCLDIASRSEVQLIERFVELVRRRDPDVLENHNIFAFDLPFLAKRAARLGVTLALGRDGSEPTLETDSFDAGERAEPFLRWRVAGREVVDTQHAVRRFGLAAPDMRRHGLKDAARYLGLARTSREYVPGVEVWPTFRTDPERVRRYAADDVDEVDGLSRRLLSAPFGLASMLPRAYERLAADCSAASLWEPLLVRAYLHEGRAITAPMLREQPPSGGTPPELWLTGVVGASARATLQSLMPSVLAHQGITAVNDELAVLTQMTGQLLDRADQDESAHVLAGAGQTYLSGHGLFSDPQAASLVGSISRQYIAVLLDELRSRGCVVVEVDGEQVTVGVPPTWSPIAEAEVASVLRPQLPRGVRLVFSGHYQALYARGPRSTITLGTDGLVTLIGSAFRAGRLERFGETFMLSAAVCALSGDALGLRQLFLDTVHRLRTAQIALEDLCVLATLHKSPRQYRRAGMREEPYEVLLEAGVRAWRVGQRIRYFRARGGELRLLVEGHGQTAAAADAEYYVQRLVSAYCQQFAQAFRREDFVRLFGVPGGLGPFVDSESVAELGAIKVIVRSRF